MGAMQAAKELGCRIPQDVSVVGFGDVPFSSMMTPGLTTVREPFHKLGNEAVEMLFSIIRGKRLSRKQVILPVELVVRGSTGAPAQG
jgi:DNA-binding LacI/PurR family transcriptional regulator